MNMLRRITILTVALSLFLGGVTVAQPVATADRAQHSTLMRRITDTFEADLRQPIAPKPLKWKAVAIPAVLISYGTLSAASGWFDEVNLLGRRWASGNEDPNRKTSIDDYSEYVPAVAVYGLNIAGV